MTEQFTNPLGSDEIRERSKINSFGYNTFIKNPEGEIIGLAGGEGVKELRVGDTVTIVSDSKGYAPFNLKNGDRLEIVGFNDPREQTDLHLLKVMKDNESTSFDLSTKYILDNI